MVTQPEVSYKVNHGQTRISEKILGCSVKAQTCAVSSEPNAFTAFHFPIFRISRQTALNKYKARLLQTGASLLSLL